MVWCVTHTVSRQRTKPRNYAGLAEASLKFYSYDFPAKQFTLYPIGDWHYGSRQADVKFIRQVVNEIKNNPEAKWVGLGDFIENAIVGSKSDVYLQTIPPKEQVDEIINILEPVREKGLFLILGNHEARTMRAVGQQPEDIISYALRVPVAGYSACAVFDLTKAHTPRSFSCYFHHGAGGGYTVGGKVNAAAKMRLIAPTADATFSGHSHTTSRSPVTWFEPGRCGILRKTGYDYITGSTLTWDESYAEEKAKRASTVEHIKVTFVGGTNGRKDGRKQIYEVIMPED